MRFTIVFILLTLSIEAFGQNVVDECFTSATPGTTFASSGDLANATNSDLIEWTGTEWIGDWPNANLTIPPLSGDIDCRGVFIGSSSQWTTGGEGFALRLDFPLVSGETYNFDITYVSHGTGSDGSFSPRFLTNNSGNLGGAYEVGLLPAVGFDWTTNTMTFTAIDVQNGHDWILFHSQGQSSGIIASFCSLCYCPNVALGDDTSLCPGQTLTLDASSPNATYLWQDNSTSPIYSVDVPGTYWVEITADGCSSTDTINVSSASVADVNLGNDSTLCEGESIILSASSSGATYVWQDNSFNPFFVASQPGTYWVEVTNQCGMSTDTIILGYNSLPVFNLGLDTTLCEGESIVLDISSPIGSYLWQDNSTNATFQVNQEGIYWVELTELGCTSVDSIQIDYTPLPDVDFGPDFELCDGESFLLNASYNGATYLWHDNSDEATFEVSTPGTYYVTSTFMGCVNTDTVNITYNPLPVVNLGIDTAICENSGLFIDASYPNAIYFWQDGSQNSFFTVEGEGTYYVYVEIENTGCSASDTIKITTHPLPTIDLGTDTVVCQDSQFRLTPTQEYSDDISWQNGSSNESYFPTNTGTYSATVFNDCGSSHDEINIEFENCDCSIFVPNGMTPDGDGKNDILKPVIDNCQFFNYQFQIFDRWGKEVFVTNNPDIGWNGTQFVDAGFYAQSNVYVWIITYDTLTADQVNSTQLMGHVTVIR